MIGGRGVRREGKGRDMIVQVLYDYYYEGGNKFHEFHYILTS